MLQPIITSMRQTGQLHAALVCLCFLHYITCRLCEPLQQLFFANSVVVVSAHHVGFCMARSFAFTASVQMCQEEPCIVLQVRWILSTCRGHIVELQPEERIEGMQGALLTLPTSIGCRACITHHPTTLLPCI